MKIRTITILLALCFICLNSAACNTESGNKGFVSIASGSDGLTEPVVTAEKTTTDPAITQPETTTPVPAEKQTDDPSKTNGTSTQSTFPAQTTVQQHAPEPGSYYLVDQEKEYPRYVIDEVLLEADWHGSTATLFKGRYVNGSMAETLSETKVGAVYYNGVIKESLQFNIASDKSAEDPSFTLLDGNVIYIKTDCDKEQSIDVFFPVKESNGIYRMAYELLDRLYHYSGSKFYYAEVDGQGLYLDHILFDTDGNYRSLPWLTEAPTKDDPSKKNIDPALLIIGYIPDFPVLDGADPDNYYMIYEIELVNNDAKIVNGNLVYTDAILVSTAFYDNEKETTIILKRSYDISESTYVVDKNYYEIKD